MAVVNAGPVHRRLITSNTFRVFGRLTRTVYSRLVVASCRHSHDSNILYRSLGKKIMHYVNIYEGDYTLELFSDVHKEKHTSGSTKLQNVSNITGIPLSTPYFSF